MQSLDLRLYAWLAEPDEWRFERAFNAYFAVAFPAVVRSLARISRWDSVRLEDVAQEALLRFFNRAGRERREALQAVRSSLARVRSVDMSPFHTRQVQSWVDDVATFADSAMNFRIEPDEAQSKATIRALIDRIEPLQRQGLHLLQGVEQQGAGSVAKTFCENVLVVIDSLPHLRVPTNRYLFQIARSIYLDECKSLGRLKRGGTGIRGAESDKHPLESLDGEEGVEDSVDDPATLPTHATRPTLSRVPATDPTQEYESEDFFARFYEYLRSPVDQAADAYRRAAANGRAVAERHKLESLTHKLSRTLAVLSAIGEGYTQEQVAQRLTLSRNQVKYIIELVQQAYARFAADATRTAASSPNAGEQPHAP